MINQPVVKLAVVGVSRDCFPAALTQKRLAAVMAELKKAKVANVVDCPVTIENENDTMKALDWARTLLSQDIPDKYRGKSYRDLYLSGELEEVKRDYPALYEKLKVENS